MTSADFSQFVVTTANETACETSPLKVRTLSLHVPATFTGTSSNFWTSAFLAALSVFPSLICDFCPSGQRFACSFLQIPPCDGHPCCSAMYFVVAYAHSGLSPVRARPWRANKKLRADGSPSTRSSYFPLSHLTAILSWKDLSCSGCLSLSPLPSPYRLRSSRLPPFPRDALPSWKCGAILPCPEGSR